MEFWLVIAVLSSAVMVLSFVLMMMTKVSLARTVLRVFGIGTFAVTVCTWSAAGYWGVSMAILWAGATAVILVFNHASSRSVR